MHTRQLFDLSGKTAIVTGGGRGIGKQIALGLAEFGANVVVCSRKIEECLRTSEELNEKGVGSLAIKCDITELEDIQHVVKETLTKFGTIDILANNSGVTWGAPLEDYPIDKWQKVMDINVNGTFMMTQAVGKVMIQRQSGKIINIASLAGLSGVSENIMDAVGYNTSKGAIVTFTKDLAAKWGKYNINVNAIAPGFFPTKMSKKLLEVKEETILTRTPLKRFGSDDDLKGVVVFLASDASAFITGEIVVVDGGFNVS